ncbi:impact family protein [Beauveria brongniartii RCEF 3172]|uniref:Impact family protein n=1 Tax=Beauveria brongniartii RCEF 3172 TaxID=1081107 RepID=A0A167E791_9HYPO|nr:impact family protein [Beauveria brongniartii RCEF 3172]
MSDELRDEVEAINSIYGDASLVVPASSSVATRPAAAAAASDYILQLPGDSASSLQLSFPSGYPETGGPPRVVGVQHSSGGVRGAGERDLRLFRAALAAVHQPGAVCLFDAVEEFSRRLDEERGAAAAAASSAAVEQQHDGQGKEELGGASFTTTQPESEVSLLQAVGLATLPPPPMWTLSEQIVDTKSTFVAHVARVTCPLQARSYVAQLRASDKRIRSATHNITAWRIRGPGAASFQDCDDDGEDAAGGRLLHLMRLMELWDAMVVVTRWYGGVKLGPRRFAVINAVARDGFVRAGMVTEGGGGKGRRK